LFQFDNPAIEILNVIEQVETQGWTSFERITKPLGNLLGGRERKLGFGHGNLQVLQEKNNGGFRPCPRERLEGAAVATRDSRDQRRA
jgi:hypothetical protein